MLSGNMSLSSGQDICVIVILQQGDTPMPWEHYPPLTGILPLVEDCRELAHIFITQLFKCAHILGTRGQFQKTFP
jgi:hypothetical protein